MNRQQMEKLIASMVGADEPVSLTIDGQIVIGETDKEVIATTLEGDDVLNEPVQAPCPEECGSKC